MIWTFVPWLTGCTYRVYAAFISTRINNVTVKFVHLAVALLLVVVVNGNIHDVRWKISNQIEMALRNLS